MTEIETQNPKALQNEWQQVEKNLLKSKEWDKYIRVEKINDPNYRKKQSMV